MLAAGPAGPELTAEEEWFVNVAGVGFMALYHPTMAFGLITTWHWVQGSRGIDLEDSR